jgi:PAS domain S-box-containing protein
MSSSSQINAFSLRRRTPSLVEFDSLLDLLPDAALLVEPRHHRILAANAAATSLTAFTRAELIGLDLRALFTGQDDWPFLLSPGEKSLAKQVTLVKRNQPAEQVRASLHPMGPDGKWATLLLKPVQEIQQQELERQRHQQMLESIELVNRAAEEKDPAQAMRLVLEAAQALTMGSYLSYYEIDEVDGKIGRFAWIGPKDIFPERLPAQDLHNLRLPMLWTPGKRSVSELQRAARTARLAYLATTPLGKASAPLGLLVVAGESAPLPEPLLYQLRLISSSAAAILQQHRRLAAVGVEIQARGLEGAVQNSVEEAVRDGLIVLAPDLSIRRLNRAASTALGYTTQEVRGQPASNILIGAESVLVALHAAQEGVPTYDLDDSRLYRRSGQGFLALVSVVPVLVEGRLLGILILINDQSEREQILAQAQQFEQQALLGEVTAIFAHEVRNPINNISTGLQLMAYSMPQEDPNQELISRLQQDCDRLAELMKSVLAFSRPTEYKMEPINLGLLLKSLIDRMRPRMVSVNVQPLLQVEPDLPLALGNPRALEQVFTNLITNAVQAMSEKGGTVAVRVRLVAVPGGRPLVEVSVADNGPGIPKENLEKIFQPFYTTKSAGTGLGLAITKRIVTAHKGNLTVQSFAGGTFFQVSLPVFEGA